MCNDEYVVPCSVMLYSFLKNNPYYNGTITILHDNKIIPLSDESKNTLSKLYGKIVFKELNYDEYSDIFEHCKGISYDGILCTYYKFEILRQNEYDKIIWLDSDMCVCGSLIDALNIDAGLVGVNFRKNDDGERIYINTGFLVIDKTKIKIENPCEYLKDKALNCDIYYFTNFISPEFRGKYGDESIFNEEFEKMFDNIVCVDKSYNYMQKPTDWKFKEEYAKIIHYMSKNKKDKPHVMLDKISKYHIVWKKYFDECESFLNGK